MKKLFALLLALMMVVSLAACGENGGTPSGNPNDPGASQSGDQGGENNSGGMAVDDITADNWAEVVSKNFGLELALPDGWSVKEASSPNHATNVKLFFNVGGEATYASFGEAIFAEVKKDAVGDITAPYDFSEIYGSFDEAQTMTGIASFRADVSSSPSVRSLIINYYDNGSNVEITIQRSGNWD